MKTSAVTLLSLLLVTCSSCARPSLGLNGRHSERIEELRQQLVEAQKERDAAQAAFAEAMQQGTLQPEHGRPLPSEDARIREQLETIVDLSALSPETPLNEAIEIIKTSVEPPLNLVVLWKDLLENADIKPTTPIGMDGLAGVRLGVALHRLLDSVGSGLYDLDYVVGDGVVTAATVDSLPSARMVARVYDIPPALRAADRTERLIAAIQEGTCPESWYDLADTGEGTISPYGHAKLVIWQTPEAHEQVRAFLDEIADGLSVMLPMETSPDTLAERIHLVQPYVDGLIGPWAQEELAGKLAPELSRIVNDLDDIRYRIARTDPNLSQLNELTAIIDRMRVHLVRYRPPAYSQGFGSMSSWGRDGWGPASPFWQLGATEEEFRDVQHSIYEILQRLLEPEFFDPEVHQIQLAARRLKLAQNRVHDLQVQIADLSAPAATGAEDDRP